MSYTYLDFKNAVNTGIHGKITSVIDIRAFLNRAVNKCNGLIDFKSTIRTSSLAPGIYRDVFTYPAPADLKEVIDIQRQRNRYEEFDATTPEQFDRTKEYDKSRLAVVEQNGVKFLNIATELNTDQTTINECDSVTDNGTWVAADDASNISVDEYNYISGSGALKYDLATGGILATITNSTMNALDLTSYKNKEIFVWQYIPNITLLTSFTARWGSSASDYWTATVTTTQEGLAFKVGWNLLKFSWPASATGTPDITAVNYFQLRINKDAAAVASNDWRTDFIVAQAGEIHDLRYYSEYFWKTSAGTYIPKSTEDTDILNASDEEFELMVQCAMDMAGATTRLEVLERQENKKAFDDNSEAYRMSNPSEKKLTSTTYYNYPSVEGLDDVTNIN